MSLAKELQRLRGKIERETAILGCLDQEYGSLYKARDEQTKDSEEGKEAYFCLVDKELRVIPDLATTEGQLPEVHQKGFREGPHDGPAWGQPKPSRVCVGV